MVPHREACSQDSVTRRTTMQSYNVRYLDESGVKQSRIIEAPSWSHLRQQLVEHGWSILGVELVDTIPEEAQRELEPESLAAPSVSSRVVANSPSRFPSRRKATPWGDFWAFRYMITPGLIRTLFVLYSIGAFGWIVAYEIDLYIKHSKNHSPGNVYVLEMGGAFLAVVLGWFILRLVFESTILFFRIYERIGEVGDRLRRL